MSDMETMKKASKKQLHPFIKGVTDDTSAISMLYCLDRSTRDKLEQLLWEVTVTMSNKTIALYNNKKQVSKKDVMSIWDHMVPKMLARVLGDSDVSSESADDVNNLIIAEVVRSVNAAITKGKKTAETTLFKTWLGTYKVDTVIISKLIKYYFMCSLELCEKQRTSKASAGRVAKRPFSHQLTVETVRPLVTSFFSGLRPKQRAALMSGTPDGDTTDRLEALLRCVTELITALLLDGLKSPRVSEKDVLSVLGNIVPRAFAEVLGVPGQVTREGAADLTNIIVKEVAESINFPVTKKRSTRKFNVMVPHALTMFKEFSMGGEFDDDDDDDDKPLLDEQKTVCESTTADNCKQPLSEMSDMSNQQGRPGPAYTMPQSTLNDLMELWKASHKALSENEQLKEGVESIRQCIKKKAEVQRKLDLCKIQAGKLSDGTTSYKEPHKKPTAPPKPKRNKQRVQVCSEAQGKPSDSELEIKSLKEQLQQRDSEILILRRENESLSAKLCEFQKDQATPAETLWNEATQREKLEQEKLTLQEENKKLLDEQKMVCESKGVHRQPEESEKVRQAKKEVREMQKELEEQKSIIQKAKKDADDAKDELQKALSEQKKLKEDGKKQNEKLMRELEEVQKELEEERKELQATKAEVAELVKKLQETNENMLEKKNLQVQQSDMQTDCNEIKKLLKQREKLEKKLLEAKEKEAKKQMKKREDEERQRQKIQEKAAKEEKRGKEGENAAAE